MKQEFLDAVKSKNLARVRISLSNELLLDPRGTTFGEMLKYAISDLPNLFEENKEANYSVPPQETWDKDFLFEVKNVLDLNFSQEKLAFYEAVIKVVGQSKIQEIKEIETKGQERKKVMESQTEERRFQINTTHATIVAGGAILAIVGICAGKTLLTVLGGVVLVVGGVMFYKDYRK